MICKKCGSELSQGTVFCPVCRVEIEQNDFSSNIEMGNGSDSLTQTLPEAGFVPPPQPQQVFNQSNFSGISTGVSLDPDKPSKKLYVLSLVLGIVALLSFFTIFGPFVLGIPAIVFGLISIKKTGAGRGMAISGISLGILSMLVAVVVFFLASGKMNFIYGEWENKSGEYFIFDNDKTYYWYANKDERDNNYYYGTFKLEYGVLTHGDGRKYGDDNSDYYNLMMTVDKLVVDKKDIVNQLPEGENKNQLVFMVDKKDKSMAQVKNMRTYNIYEVTKVK
jgi:hypothetical protein